MNLQHFDRKFVLWAGITLVFLYLVILAGSIVRATGSGMGCPDWPKCFGLYIPPTEVSEIEFKPQHDYNKGMLIISNDTLWRSKDHFTSTATFDHANWEKYPKHDYAEFNASQTWTEYINRLCGALSGVASLFLLYFAFARRKHDKTSLWMVIAHFAVLLFVAWLGKVVVDSNLKPATITMHMLCALIMVFLMIYVRGRASDLAGAFEKSEVTKGMRAMLIFSLCFTLAQIMLGTQVRQQVDELTKAGGDSRDTWIAMLSSKYTVHFSMAMVLTLVNVFIWFRLKNTIHVAQGKRLLHATVLIVLITYGAGVVMHRFGIPAMVQPVHLFFAMVLAGVQFALILRTK